MTRNDFDPRATQAPDGLPSIPPLEGRTAFVAGATGPVGRSIVKALAARGARVAVHCRSNLDAATTLAKDVPAGGFAVQGDLTLESDVEAVFEAVEHALAPVDILVNAAHGGQKDPVLIEAMSPDDFDGHIRNVRAHFLMCRRALPSMRRQRWGRIVFISGALMTRLAPGSSAYGAAKSAATTLTRYVALEEGRAGITANVVALGRIAEPGLPEPEDESLRRLSARLLEGLALGAFPAPADVAETVTMLVQPSSAHITGQILWVTGGEMIG